MPPVEQLEFRSFRSRVHSLEQRLQRFEQTAMWMLHDISHSLGIKPTQPPSPSIMLKTPAEIVDTLRRQYPDLEKHPLWETLEAAIEQERRELNQVLQQAAGNVTIAFRQYLEVLLHPVDPLHPVDTDADAQNSSD